MTIDEAFVMFAAGFGVGCISIIVLIGLVGCPMTAPIEAWAIKAPEHLGGKIDNVCVRASRQDAIESCGNWKWAFEHGYRCVRVHITEAMPE